MSSSVVEITRLFGTHSNSFLVLYDGYRYFSPPHLSGKIAYVETPSALIAATEPIGPSEERGALLRAFQNEAAERKKSALLIPVREACARTAEAMGFGVVKIGDEPIFDFDNYVPDLSSLSVASRFHAKGARVQPVDIASMTSTYRRQIDGLVAQWLASRKMSRLHFLNRVEPWTLSSHKKYFVTIYRHEITAFLAAVPVPASDGWYFVDLIRSPDSPPGSTELLLLESMRMVKEEGAKWVSLGVAPLSGLSASPAVKSSWRETVLRLVYEHGNVFYNFRSLHEFKLKFAPTRQEPNYLIYFPNRLRLKSVWELLSVFLGRSVGRSLLSSGSRAIVRWEKIFRRHSNPELVLRPESQGFGEVISRCPLTLALLAMQPFFYMATRGLLPHSPSLFWNLITLVLCCGGLEYVAGTALMGSCYLIGALFCHGQSLGITACLGGLICFFKRRKSSLAFFSAISAIAAFVSGDPASLNHLASLLLGFTTASWKLFW